MTEWFTATNEAVGYNPQSIIINMVLALLTGLAIGFIYKKTHKGLSYSQSFVITLVLMCITVSAVMMVIGSNLARAFALVGALTIVRFRTVVKDTKDTAFIFFALTEGIACGTGNYTLATFSTIFISSVALLLNKTDFGSVNRSEFIIRFRFDRINGDEKGYVEYIVDKTRKSTLIHIEPSDDGKYLILTYDLVLVSGFDSSEMVVGLQKIQGVDRINLVAASKDINY